MSPAETLLRLRRFLLIFSVFLLAGTVVELLLVNHTENTVQFIPFILCGLGLIAVISVLIRTQRATLLVLRGCMGLIMCGTVFGIYEHVTNNIAFQLEIRPNISRSEMLSSGLRGANPLLAPGILAVAATLALAATYNHPLLDPENQGMPGY
jgi:hypothetical protein